MKEREREGKRRRDGDRDRERERTSDAEGTACPRSLRQQQQVETRVCRGQPVGRLTAVPLEHRHGR
eukprot:2038813-Pyramimonas_sp.AAC.1